MDLIDGPSIVWAETRQAQRLRLDAQAGRCGSRRRGDAVQRLGVVI